MRRPVALSCLAVALAAAGCGSGGGGSSEGRLRPDWRRGMNFTSFLPNGYATKTADDALAALRPVGVTDVAIVVTWYMDGAASSRVAPDPAKTPTDASVLRAMAAARRLGFGVSLKPQVDVRDGTFRGDIAPASSAAWFDSYRTMLDRYAGLAARGGADGLVVGTELTSMARDTASWRALIARARQRFGGRLTFAANWVQGAEQVGFWDGLDEIGIDAYMPLAGDTAAAWRPWIDRASALHSRWGKPVLLTELGYQSRAGAAQSPAGGNGPVDAQAQARAYEAAFRAWSKVPWLEGIYWWEWSADGLNADTNDGSFRPAGKPAQKVLEDWQGSR